MTCHGTVIKSVSKQNSTALGCDFFTLTIMQGTAKASS